MKTKFNHTLCGLLLLVSLAWAVSANAMVRVYGVAASSGELVTVDVFADITSIPIVSYTAKVFYDPGLLHVVDAIRNETVWYLYDGTNQVPYLEPDVSQPGEVLFVGGRMDVRDPLAGVMGRGILLGTVVFSRLDTRTPEFAVSIGREGSYASFVTTNGITLDALPGEVAFAGVAPTGQDQDLDGLTDRWEEQYFESVKLAFYSDDPDGDGVNNLGEEDLGSDPTDPDSNLQLRIRRQDGIVRLDWTSFEKRTYTIEASSALPRFRPLETGIRATPPINSYEFRLPKDGGETFFRILLEPREQR